MTRNQSMLFQGMMRAKKENKMSSHRPVSNADQVQLA